MPVQNIVYQKNIEENTLKVLAFNDHICFAKLKLHDQPTFRLVYKRYSTLIYGSIISVTGNEKKASAILESTFVKAWESISLFDESKCTLFTWLQRISKIETLK